MIFINKEQHKDQIIDVAIPYDTRVDDKEVEKSEKHLDLARELKNVWNMKVAMFSLVVGAVVTPVEVLQKKLRDIGIETKITELQKTVLIYTSRILRNVLEV